MAKCPNCGQEAARTKDWVCEWCGYPLPDGSFKKIDKTFRELKEARLTGQPVTEEAAPEDKPEPAIKIRPEALSKLRPQPAKKPDPPPPQEPEPARGSKPAPEANKPTPARPPEPTTQPKSAVKPEAAAEVKPQAESEPRPEPVAAKPEMPEPAPETRTEPGPADIEITVAELLSAYEADGVASDARFTNKTLKITGVIDKINVKEALNIYSLTLNSPKKSLLLQGVRCVFDSKYGAALNRMSIGQTVTVQGKYTGTMIDISLRDCFLVL